MKRTKLDKLWDNVWDNYDLWFQEEDRRNRCGECGSQHGSPDWDDQKAKIRELVEKNFKRIK